MFGLSLPKILLLVLVVVGVWAAFRIIGRKRHAGGDGVRPRPPSRPRSRSRRAEGGRIAAEDMIACPRCGVFVSAERADPCQRSDCPYR